MSRRPIFIGSRPSSCRSVSKAFLDLERAKTWYRSVEYAAALAIRDDAISRDMILVVGLA
ncbi:MAG TPA: DUF1330 domain-containing protein [Xanthobacteraceae bacterium]|nr:DUF1330 domain-containing protein [Xanthobacteraceae bacterium]